MSDLLVYSKSFPFAGISSTQELFPGWGHDVVWATKPWETSDITIRSAEVSLYAYSFQVGVNIGGNVCIGNSAFPDQLTPTQYGFGAWNSATGAATMILNAKHSYASGQGAFFPASSSAVLPNAPHLDVHLNLTIGAVYSGTVVIWYTLNLPSS